MKVTKTVEVRTARPVYFRGEKGQGIHMAVHSGRGYCTPVPATAVKVQRLTTGQYSIRCVEGGGFASTLRVSPNTFVVMVTEDGDNLFGKVSEIFDNAQV